ncbi:hypothetical protein L218DRAFT_951408 [Marasmius fiardii PR-910]|nr:hypothetical protein L218DRAFT_951408 [Marasmius fiardii PR-910]
MFSFKSLVVLSLLALCTQITAVPAEATAATVVAAANAATSSQSTAAATNASLIPDVFTNVNPVGQVVIAQGLNNQPSLLIYQDASSGDLVTMGVSNSFSVGHRTTEPTVIVPSAEILWGSPLAIINYEQGVNNAGLIQVFYLSPDNVITETGGGQVGSSNFQWKRGSTQCPTCIDSNVILRAAQGSRVFYAVATTDTQSNAGVRLVFQSADYPAGTLVEAEWVVSTSTWGLYPLKD